jgi:hypothetical protein
MKTLPKPGRKYKKKIQGLSRGLVTLERNLRIAALLCKHHGPYAWGYCEALSADLRDLRAELEELKREISHQHQP